MPPVGVSTRATRYRYTLVQSSIIVEGYSFSNLFLWAFRYSGIPQQQYVLYGHVVVEYLQHHEHSIERHRTEQHNHPCTKQQTKYVSIRTRQRNPRINDRVGESQQWCRAFSFVHIKSTRYARTCIRHPGCSPGVWGSWRLEVACLHLKCWTICLICLSLQSILSCERAEPPATRSALYLHTHS